MDEHSDEKFNQDIIFEGVKLKYQHAPCYPKLHLRNY